MAAMDGHPLLQLAIGVVWFVSCAGLGAGLMRELGLGLRAPWFHVTSVLAGLLTPCMAVFAAAACGVASRAALVSLFAVVCAAGLPLAWRLLRRLAPRRAAPPAGWARLPAAAALLGLLMTLATAMAPSSKHDELHYHMLVAKRIVEDGELVAYRRPWQSSFAFGSLVQMGGAPLHAVGVPDAANVVSWCTGLTLAWLVWYLLSRRGAGDTWPWVWLPLVTVGFHFGVLAPVAGPHMFGDLAAVSCLLLLLDDGPDAGDARREGEVLAIGILALCATVTKVVFLPFAIAAMVCALVQLRRSRDGARGTVALATRMAVAWLLIACPAIAWTWWRTGSPAGAVTARWIGDGYFTPGVLPLIDTTLAANRHGLARFAYLFAVGFTPLAVAGPVYLFMRSVDRGRRAIAASVCAVQLVAVALFAPRLPRMLAALPVAGAVLTALHAGERFVERAGRWVAIGAAVVVTPWLAAQAWYASAFVAVALGVESREAFGRARVAAYEDYRELDRILPADATLYWSAYRINAAYAPRPVYLHAKDIPAGAAPYVVVTGALEARATLPGFRFVECVYENPDALLVAYRTPGVAPVRGRLRAFRTEREGEGDTDQRARSQ